MTNSLVRPVRIVLCTFLVALASGPAARAVTYVNPAGGNHIAFSICPALDGANFLDPDPVTQLGVMSQEMFDELTMGDTAYPGWTFQSAVAPLNGTFHIDTYKSRFTGAHVSGAQIEIRYVRGAGDPPAANMRWVQLITTNAPLDPNGPAPPGPPTSPYLDPYPDDADGEGGPFYYSDQAGSRFDYREHVNGANFDAHFYDFSRRPHPPTSYVEWQGELFLTELSAPKNVVFHDGMKWGFRAGCINWRFLIGHTFGRTTVASSAIYDVATETLSFAPVTIDVLNRAGSFSGVDPDFFTDPMLNAQMVITPFQRVPGAELPPGLVLFGGGSVHVFAGPNELFAARIPYLLLGDDMSQDYNATGVYADVQVLPGPPSQFLLEYESFRLAGQGPSLTAGSAADRTNPDGITSDVGSYPFEAPGHSPQLYVKTTRSIPDLLTNGGPTDVAIWNSFGPRDPEGGLLLQVSKDAITWGDLGSNVLYDLTAGVISSLRTTGGDFANATTECLANDAPVSVIPYTFDPPAGDGQWFLVRAKRGAIVGTYDTLQPSQVAPRDAQIELSGLGCP